MGFVLFLGTCVAYYISTHTASSLARSNNSLHCPVWLGSARFPVPLPYVHDTWYPNGNIYAIRQYLPTWRDHSCNMKLLVADNIFS